MAYWSPRKRAAIWHRERMNAYLAGLGENPICNLCDAPVLKCEAWDVSHAPERPRSFGGNRVGVAHLDCNRRHGVAVVTPAFAKSERVRQFDIGARGPGLSKHPLPAGRRSTLSKTFANGVVPRLTLAEKIARMRERRAIAPGTAQS
ncbi:MAG TPA: hypothetical protein VH678_14305 [Xanthobacteraceae bacterium]|jgi:hypothetical protein